ncbi:magnesium transporter [Pseudooceanicola antarcticus]|uniref:Magnesium transporter MgtE n=1 Tax=Pseudooceanicola antarcticus TaxID=1247613 RepID=A0A285IGW2_9RHOB|nr:magnesium transporter [Pseudooceanicola antarcticus]PJE29014.1 magnesium transporter [Pseudooceanicola antarcticus]SNY47215.1 magnesium transporter [Pseudooceanicola antarcticus]
MTEIEHDIDPETGPGGTPAPEDETGQDDQGYTLDRRKVSAILYAVDAEDREELIAQMEPLHAADIADLLEQINAYDRRRLVLLYDLEFDGEILSELNESIREEVISLLTPGVLQDAVRELDSDDVVDLVEYLEEEQQEAVLDALEDSDRVAVEQALSYPEESAGRLMQREVVAVPEFWTVGQAIDMMREREDLPEQFYHVILIDPKMRPVAHVTLGKLMASPRRTALSEITEPGFRTIPAQQDEGDVAYAFNQYHIISAPVVDEDERLVGVITIDDAMIVLDEEHEEDIMRLAGVGEGNLNDRVSETLKQRLPWLAVNLLTAVLASLVISVFDETIAQFVALAVLMPIVASMGGNAGTQSLTVAVRAIATKDLTGSNVWRVIRRELAVGLLNGLAFALTMALLAILWFGNLQIALVLAVAMVINLAVAGLAGIGVPVLLDKLKVDPALASGTFVTTVTDVVGFFAFLGLAGLVLL